MSTFASPNFHFLAAHAPLLVTYAAAAERYVFTDPNTALIKLRQFAEVLARQAAAYAGVHHAGATFVDVERSLTDRGVLGPDVAVLLRGLRRTGNAAAHEHRDRRGDAFHQLKMARKLAVWFHRAFGHAPAFAPGPFVPPPNPDGVQADLRAELERLREELAAHRARSAAAASTASAQAALRAAAEEAAAAAYGEMEAALALAEETAEQLEAERARFEAQLARAQGEAEAAPEAVEAKVRAASAASADVRLTEAETRRLIDCQLVAAGWEADSEALRFARGTRPVKGRNLAIAEWPTASGPADYVLFVGLRPVAVVEAKRRSVNVASRIDQAQRYAGAVTVTPDLRSPGGPWGAAVLPFVFATNGRPFLRQLLTHSGVWFRDLRRPTNHPRALQDWYTPDGLVRMLRHDPAAAEDRLATESSETLPLRDYQRAAVAAVERAIAAGDRDILLAMATGTGKTRTAIGLVYRLVKAGRFERVLFLVDRSALGVQAFESFDNLKLEQLQPFTRIYDVKELGDVVPDPDTRLHFATVQGMVKRLLYPTDGAAPVPVDQYDCIVVDECHRGYNLDRELSDAELTFRSEADYVSTYRRVLDHFDAVRIGLTATPALHTTEIFGDPVYTYSYRQAVVDGHLVDHEPPVRIVTRLAEDGIHFMAGEEVPVYRARTQQLDLIHLPDQVDIEVEGFNRRVLTEGFNRAVCRELARRIDPSLPGKTLVFCVTDAHADDVVRLLKEALVAQYGPTDDAVVQKITGNADKPQQRIRHFKNEPEPCIVVTVDLLTTGVDVPAIVNLVFLRRVRSRILYEQMKGRATRRCDAIGKRYFRIFDAVGLYDALEPHTSMRPVVVDPKIGFRQLVDELLSLPDGEARDAVHDQLRAKLHRKVRGLGAAAREAFAALAGDAPAAVSEALKTQTADEAAAWWRARSGLARWLDETPTGEGPAVYVSDEPDEVRRVEVGFGDADDPGDYLESFGAFLRDNLNALPALVVVTQRPRDLTRQQLRELALALREAGFTEARLQVAVRESTNQDIAASIIGFIRQQALGSPLVPYAERVDRALRRVLAGRRWTAPQRRWLQRIGEQMKTNTVVDRGALDEGQFVVHGGFRRLDRVFDGELEAVLGALAEAVWEDAG